MNEKCVQYMENHRTDVSHTSSRMYFIIFHRLERSVHNGINILYIPDSLHQFMNEYRLHFI